MSINPIVWLFALLCTLLSPFSIGQSTIIHEQKSLYQDIVVFEHQDFRCLSFTAKRGERVQTCEYQDPQDKRIYFPYVRMTLAGLLFNPKPERILIIGLGGGSVPSALAELYPESHMDIVEIDPVVSQIAERYFYFQPSHNTRVHTGDARVYIKRAGLKGQKYDFILLDAFNGEYIPEHLMTQEFLMETKQLLSSSGVLVANTFSTSKLYDHESATYRSVFGEFYNFKIPQESGNRVILSMLTPLPNQQALQQQAEALVSALQPFAIEIENYPSLMTLEADWDEQARLLTDQFSPANLLK
ncbi:spermidine synthase [Vibrio vulnificus]|uniref:spermidine synthase n=1 Tax=Vibrio vulnificus TaxID=672 RepID=UPI0019D4E8E0|nr:fused MFS/spermidine synthase [Vibrio vulnificus]EJT0552208.1 fused MFS/spermidine synthase [Vibrio vulnificus]MBN8129875.1 fused MFS/spermidine synthase [Vibrio vulnificus]MBN8134499.1 fused MFS/spermidine synthase [Vibrio vulnificus]MBN8157587.1 fused MFS/spermidine synthase [Vibrio vulnificus]